MILVTGSTGHLGKAVIAFLLKKVHSNQIAALARDPKKAEDLTAKGIDVKQGDYSDYDSLVKAFEGIEKLLLVSSSALAGVAEQHANAINAATKAGVKHIIYTSIVSRSENPHFKLINDYKKKKKNRRGFESFKNRVHDSAEWILPRHAADVHRRCPGNRKNLLPCGRRQGEFCREN